MKNKVSTHELIIWRNAFLKKRGLINIEKLAGGLTNQSYLVKTKKGKFVCRFAPKNLALLGIDKKRELWNTKQAFLLGIGPEPLVYEKKNSLMIVSYMEGIYVPKKIIHTKACVAEFARVLSKLHATKKFKGLHDPQALAKMRLRYLLKRKSVLFSEVQAANNLLLYLKKKMTKHTPVSSHVDLTYENMLIRNKKISFIDWEYSAKSDPCVDIAMASIEFGWNEKDEKYFLKKYVTKQAVSFTDIQIGKCMIHLREVIWGLVQHEVVPHENDYLGYAKKRLQRFNTLVSKMI